MGSLYRAVSFRLNLAFCPGFAACCTGLSAAGSRPARAAEKLKILDDNPVPASLGTVLRRPLLEREASFHKEGSALAHILVERLGGLAEGTANSTTGV
ncbi:MAG: hypothetical protein ABSG97_03215 [Sedimentisphaerales bacterium]